MFDLTRIAEYPTRELYVGPLLRVAAAIPALRAEGYDAALATELDSIEFHAFTLDAESGAVTPPISAVATPGTGEEGLYLLSLQGYALRTWLDELQARGTRIVESLPPAGYLVRGRRTTIESLRSSTTFVRGAFPLRPEFKKVFLERPASSSSPYRPVAIDAVQESPSESIRPYLDSVSGRSVIEAHRGGNRVTYEAALSDVDIDLLSRFENVYAISATGEAEPSSERQGVLALQPTFTGNRMTLLPASPNYASLLVNLGIPTFDNTVFGIVDTGFDNGDIAVANIHADFKYLNGSQEVATVISAHSEFTDGYQDDRDFHGTITTSILAASAPYGQRQDGTGSVGYRYSLGLAPTTSTRVNKYFHCTQAIPPLSQALDRFLTGTPVNVVNLSFNDPDCGYTPNSRLLDDLTVQRSWLFTVSAGNVNPNDPLCDYVKGPATAKSAIAVGSTDSFLATPELPPQNTFGSCAWAGVPPVQDARNIPSFSARWQKGMRKPDLVAPGVRITGPEARPINRPELCTGAFGVFCRRNIHAFPPDITYGFSAGTSFAAPAVAGAAGVIRKWFRNLNAVNPSPAMTKAILINGARDIAGATVRHDAYQPITTVGHIPDDYQGWGMLNLTRLLGHAGDYYFFDQGAELVWGGNVLWQKLLYVRDGTKDIRITLAWSEPGNTSLKLRPLNDLDLSVDQTGGCPCWYGNQISAATGYSLPSPPAPVTPDGDDNVEQVIIPAYSYPTRAQLRLSVVFSSSPGGAVAQQRFAVFADNASESPVRPPTYFYTVPPCRVIDTRAADSQFGGPALQADSERTFQIPPQCGVPPTARSIAISVAVTQTSATGNLRFYPTGISSPPASTIYYAAGQTRASNAIIGLGPTRSITVRTSQPAPGSAHLILDISGYFQ